MRPARLGAAARPAIALAVCLSAPATLAQSQLTLDWPAMARAVVARLAPEPGERILIVAHPGIFERFIPHLRYALVEAGAVDLGVVDVLEEPVPGDWDLEALRRNQTASRAAYRQMFGEVDGAIMLPGAVPAHPAYGALQDLLNDGRGRTIHFHWVENGSAYVLPGQPLPARHVLDATYQRSLLTTDYAALATIQRRFEAAMRGQLVHITSPLGTDLRFRIDDRPVNKQDGDASAARTSTGRILIDREIELPAGVVRVAPIEESIDGTIAFPPSQWDGQPVEHLILTFAGGRVVDVTATRGQEAAEAEFASAPDAARSFREFALGFNPTLAVPERSPWIPYYGYGSGVVRLSLGDNSELGGRVTGGYVRWNFFTDLTVTVGDTTWVRDGRLVVE
jgi:hypothetical protein